MFFKLARAYFIALIILASSQSQAMDEYENKRSSRSKGAVAKPSKSGQLAESQIAAGRIMEEGYFVHAVKHDLFAPQYDLTLRAGSMISTLNLGTILKGLGSFYQPYSEQFRPCLYFSLQCLVEGHEDFNLSHYSSVVFLPAPYMLKLGRITNLFPTDTAVWLSELKLRDVPGAVIMTPKGSPTRGCDLGEIQLHRYTGDITKAANKLLEKLSGFRVTLKSDPHSQFYKDKAFLGDVDISSPEAFQSYLHPSISFGHEKGPLTPGLGVCISFLNTFVNEFNEFWKIGILKSGIGKGPQFIKKYRVESFLRMGEVILEEMEKCLKAYNIQILTEFQEQDKWKVLRAISNMKNLVKVRSNSSKPGVRDAWNNRHHTLTISFRLADFPLEVAEKVIHSPCMESVREENIMLYWFWRYSQEFFSVQSPDGRDTLIHLQEAVGKLRLKLDAGHFGWSYAQLMNGVLGVWLGMRHYDGAQEYYLKGLQTISSVLPLKGFYLTLHNDGECRSDILSTLNDHGLSITNEVFQHGVRVPNLNSKRNSMDSM